MGAWIETECIRFYHISLWSHPTWVRGLKLDDEQAENNNNKSHPTWVRGLKLRDTPEVARDIRSHPTWVRGLKHFTFNCTFMELKFPKGFSM